MTVVEQAPGKLVPSLPLILIRMGTRPAMTVRMCLTPTGLGPNSTGIRGESRCYRPMVSGGRPVIRFVREGGHRLRFGLQHGALEIALVVVGQIIVGVAEKPTEI